MPDSISKLYEQNRAAQLENKSLTETDASGNPVFKQDEQFSAPALSSPIKYSNNTGVDYIGKYTNYIPSPALLSPDANINQIRAQGQSGGEQALNTALRFLPNAVLGAVGNLASSVDLEDYYNVDNEFGNPIEKTTNSLMNSINNALPIYHKNAGKSFDFGDSGYVWDNISQLANSVGAFALSGWVTGGLLSGAAKAIAGEAGIAALEGSAKAKALKLINTGELAEKDAPAFIENYVSKKLYAAPTLINAAAMNQSENIMEGISSYDQVYKMKLDQGYSDSEAKQKASDAVDVSLNINRLNFFSNISSAGLFTGARGAIEKAFGGFGKTILAETGQEALEEGINYIAQTEAALKGEQEDKYKYDLTRSIGRLGETQGLESMMLGGLGGAGSTIVTHGVVPQVEPVTTKIKSAIKDLKDAAGLNGKKSVIDKFDSSYQHIKDVNNYIEDPNTDIDQDPDGFANEFAASSIAHDAVNSEENGPINMSSTNAKIDILKNILDDKNKSDAEKQRAKSAIDALESISKLANNSGIAGKENAKEILSSIVGMEAVRNNINDIDAKIADIRNLPQNTNPDGTVNEENITKMTKNLEEQKASANVILEAINDQYKQATSDETQNKFKEARKAKAEEIKSDIDEKKISDLSDTVSTETEPIVIDETPFSDKKIINNIITKEIPSLDKPIIPLIKGTNNQSIHDIFGLSGIKTEDEDGNIVERGRSQTQISDKSFKDITGDNFDYENPSIHLFKEEGAKKSDDRYFSLEPNPTGSKLNLNYIKKATSDDDALFDISQRAVRLNNSIESYREGLSSEKDFGTGKLSNIDNKFADAKSPVTLTIGNFKVDINTVQDVLDRIDNGENVDIESEYRKRGVYTASEKAQEVISNSVEEKSNARSNLNDRRSKATIIKKDIQDKTLSSGKKRINAIAVNYLALKYSFVKVGDLWVMKNKPEGVNNQFLKNSDIEFTEHADIVMEIADGPIPSIARNSSGRPIMNADGTMKTKTISAEEAAKDNKQYGDSNKFEMPIAIYILSNGKKDLIGYLPEHMWLNEKDDSGSRTHIAEVEDEKTIRAKVEEIKQLREEFKKQFNKGNKTFNIQSKITAVGAGTVMATETAGMIMDNAPDLALDVAKYTGDPSRLWATIEGGEAVGIDGNQVPDSIRTELENGVPVVMVPTANGLLSPEVAIDNGVGVQNASSILNAISLFQSQNTKDILYDLGARWHDRKNAPMNESTDDGMRRIRRAGLREYLSQFVWISDHKLAQANLGYSTKNNGKFYLTWSSNGKRKIINENEKISTELANLLVSDFAGMKSNFSREHLKNDYHKSVPNSVVIINDDLSHSELAKSISDFYMKSRSINFKAAGKIGSGESEKNVYFLQPVLEFSVDDQIGSKETITPISNNITPDDNLKTFDLGDLVGTDQNQDIIDEVNDMILNHPNDAIHGGESFNTFAHRVKSSLIKAIKSAPNNSTIVTHNTAFGLIRLWDSMGRPSKFDENFRKEYIKLDSNTGASFKINSDNGILNIARHGETEDNKKNNFRSDDTKLTKLGESQAADLGKQIGATPLIITSSLERAIHTSNIILTTGSSVSRLKSKSNEKASNKKTVPTSNANKEKRQVLKASEPGETQAPTIIDEDNIIMQIPDFLAGSINTSSDSSYTEDADNDLFSDNVKSSVTDYGFSKSISIDDNIDSTEQSEGEDNLLNCIK